MDYVGGDEEMSEIEMEKLSLPELKDHLREHMELKESMKVLLFAP
jgi:hypothetical protein